ncbi:hypothetical protein VM1G_11553 [Cytospora mali]|uniref:Uncharacterized protein n=1 Tax=Cytospora mali TaxID=578113 RepID=A0A194VW42_CYTMA|nr:hypothetical protein VM1G_11553 [Valsa mali]
MTIHDKAGFGILKDQMALPKMEGIVAAAQEPCMNRKLVHECCFAQSWQKYSPGVCISRRVFEK